MKQKYEIFNTYLSIITKDIKDRHAKKEVKEEIFSHLMDHYDMNIALRMSHEEAQRKAVEKMGDTESVAEIFKQLYPVSSADYFKYTGKLLALGLIFSTFNIYSYRGLNAMYAYSIILLWALHRIKNINKTLHKAYILSYINSVLQTLFLIARNNFLIDADIVVVSSILLSVVMVVPYIFTIIGLIRVRKQLGEEKPYIGLGIIAILAIIMCFSITTLQLYNNRIELCFLAAFISLFPAGFMYTISEDDINRLNTGVPGRKKISIKRLLLISMIIAIGMSSTFTAEMFAYYKPVEYVTDDINENVDEIRNNLVDLGLPKQIADELPESEILRYHNATDLQITTAEKTISTDLQYMSYNFILNDEENSLTIRTLMIINEFDDFDASYYTGFLIDYYQYDSNNIFCKFLCDYDGMTKEILPIKSAPVEYSKQKDYYFLFPNTKKADNHRAYISMTFKTDISTEIEDYGLSHWYEQSNLSEINNPYQSYIIRVDDWLDIGIKNPYYIDNENKDNT